MQFHEYRSCYDELRRIVREGKQLGDRADQSIVAAYEVMVSQGPQSLKSMCHMCNDMGDTLSAVRAHMEYFWYQDQQPYYNIYPSIVPMLRKIDTDIACGHIPAMEKAISVRLPVKDNPFKYGDYELRSFVFWMDRRTRSFFASKQAPNRKHLVFSIDTGERSVCVVKVIPWVEELTISELIDSLPVSESMHVGMEIHPETIVDAIKIALGIYLIHDDPELVERDVLNKDADKFARADATQKQVIIDRALRRGKNGFNLGKRLEVSPHYRRMHLAKFWVGKGRKEVRVQLRKHSIVHREKLTNVPTGYLGMENNQKEE